MNVNRKPARWYERETNLPTGKVTLRCVPESGSKGR